MQAHDPCRIAVIGVGALGTEVTLQIAENAFLAHHLGESLLVDPDCIEASNVTTSRVYGTLSQQQGEALLGQSKALATAGYLQSLAAVSWTALSIEFADLSWARLASLDLLISCTDNALVRTEIAFAARALGLPVLDGAVLGQAETPGSESGGRLTWFSPSPEAACYLCGLSTERRSELLAYASTPSLGCHPPAIAPMGTGPFLTSSLQQTATAVVDRLCRIVQGRETANSPAPPSSFAVRLLPGDAPAAEPPHTLQRSSSCPWHEVPLPLATIEPDETFRERLFDLAPATPPIALRLQFPWPICVLSRCLACGASSNGPQRLAFLRRRARCQNCGAAHQLEPLQTVASVGHNDAVARRTPRQLGWSERQLFQLRPSLVPVVTGKEQP